MATEPTGTALGAQHDLAMPFKSIRSVLDRHARRDPDKTALYALDQEKSISFGELRRMADRVARRLLDQGIGKGDRVAVLSDESLEKLIIWLGVWRIGAVICPLNIEMNIAYVSELLKTVEPKLTLWHEDLDGAAMTRGVGGDIVRFSHWDPDAAGDAESEEFFTRLAADADGPAPDGENGPDDVACIYCTSGTTDKPKLIVFDHIGFWLFGLSSMEQVGHTEDERTLEYRSFGWSSVQGMTLMPWLQTGCTLYFARHFSQTRFFEWVRDHKITFSVGIPTAISMLMNRPVDINEADVESLRMISCSTAPLSPERWKQFEQMYGVNLCQMYGSSEAGWVCGNRHYAKKYGTVGPPSKHQEFLIIDGQGNPCPPGVEGEVTVGGPACCIATISTDGVWDDVKGTRFHMGDLAVMDEDGYVTVTGRLKDIIIRGGVNISPLEIDNVLLAYDQIAEAAAVGVPDEIYGEEVICYVVPKPGVILDANEIRAHCAKTLPEFRMPKQIHMVDELPKNDRGKVKRDLLREKWQAERSTSAT
jgi:acyl-coenzyme A synthetase/AMP-(fatty) acid ligase